MGKQGDKKVTEWEAMHRISKQIQQVSDTSGEKEVSDMSDGREGQKGTCHSEGRVVEWKGDSGPGFTNAFTMS